VRIYQLVVEPSREEHIAAHHVSVEGAEEVVFGTPVILRTRQGRYLLVGQTEAGRYLSVVVARSGPGVYSLVTARDADASERSRYQALRRR